MCTASAIWLNSKAVIDFNSFIFSPGLFQFHNTRTHCRDKSRITLSIKQLEEDPLLETLDKVIHKVRCANDRILVSPPSWNLNFFSSCVILLLMNYNTLQEASVDTNSLDSDGNFVIEPLPGLETIIEELMQEDGYVWSLILGIKSFIRLLYDDVIRPICLNGFLFINLLQIVSFCSRMSW